MIPVVDFHLCGVSVPETDVKESNLQTIGNDICDAFKTVGFVYLVNHGIPREKIEKARDTSQEFFQLPLELKTRHARSGSGNNFGYVGMEMEKLSEERPGDLKETYNMTPKDESSCKWPDEIPHFKQSMWDLYNICQELSYRVLRAIGAGLHLKDREIFVKSHSELVAASTTTLRSLYYPALPSHYEIKEKQIRCGEHSDYGSITLLFQDQVGGLEVMNRRTGEYVAATPIEGAVLVNVGDLMQRWTSDILVSTKHRVLIPPEELKRREVRQSLAFFVHPDDAKIIECIDGSHKYPPISSLDYLNERFAVSY